MNQVKRSQIFDKYVSIVKITSILIYTCFRLNILKATLC